MLGGDESVHRASDIPALARAFERTKELQVALRRSRSAPNSLDAELHSVEQELYSIDEALNGNRSRGAVGEANVHTVRTRLRAVSSGTRSSTYGPTPTHRRSLETAEEEFRGLRERLNAVLEDRLPALEKALEEAGAPWTQGQPLPPVP